MLPSKAFKMAVMTNNILQIMALIDWTTFASTYETVMDSPDVDHEITLFEFVHTRPRSRIHMDQMLPSGDTVLEAVEEESTHDFFKSFLSFPAHNVFYTTQRMSDEKCSFAIILVARGTGRD